MKEDNFVRNSAGMVLASAVAAATFWKDAHEETRVVVRPNADQLKLDECYQVIMKMLYVLEDHGFKKQFIISDNPGDCQIGHFIIDLYDNTYVFREGWSIQHLKGKYRWCLNIGHDDLTHVRDVFRNNLIDDMQEVSSLLN